MSEVQVRFQEYKGIHAVSRPVKFDMPLDTAYTGILGWLGLPDNSTYRFGLVRTGEILKQYLTFREAGIEQNDEIILIPQEDSSAWESQALAQLNSNPAESKVKEKKSKFENSTIYKLVIVNPENLLLSWEYSIQLKDSDEDKPYKFFTQDNRLELEKFDNSLRKFLNREVSGLEIEKTLREWCNEISQGYRTTSLQKK